MSPKQSKVMAYLKDNGSITVFEAVELIGQDVYCNPNFHCGNVLSNMVKRGMIKRLKRGVYGLHSTAIVELSCKPEIVFRNSITIDPRGELPMRQESTADLSECWPQ